MFIDEFPVPVTLIHDEVQFGARILVHRRVHIVHVDGLNCPCEPFRFTREEAERLTCQALNDLLDTGVH